MQFMTQEWFDAVGEELRNNLLFTTAIANVELRLQQVATDVPSGGDIRHCLSAERGSFHIGVGDVDDPDATLTATYADAVQIHKGELDAMSAFSSGRMLVEGNIATLMQHQAAIAQMNTAMEALRGRTEYEE